MTDLESLVSLNAVSGLGSISVKRLLEYFGDAKKVFSTPESALRRVKGISTVVAQNIRKGRSKFEAKKELELADKNHIRIISIFDKDYPENLKAIYDAPVILYIKGEFLKSDNLAIGIVGSRRASLYGVACAEKFALQLAELGITIVSGMARGIDSASHRGALRARGRTIAVLGSGLLNIYPPENQGLFKEISDSGVVISEFPLETSPFAGNFPRRNRIISGLSLGLIVAEASRNSGALITADLALEQGREVFAIPGKVDAVNSFGVNSLIKQGAKLVTSVEDVLSELSPRLKGLIKDTRKPKAEKASSSGSNLNDEEAALYNLISRDKAKQIDELVNESRLSAASVAAILTNLELRRIIKQLPGKQFVRSHG